MSTWWVTLPMGVDQMAVFVTEDARTVGWRGVEQKKAESFLREWCPKIKKRTPIGNVTRKFMPMAAAVIFQPWSVRLKKSNRFCAKKFKVRPYNMGLECNVHFWLFPQWQPTLWWKNWNLKTKIRRENQNPDSRRRGYFESSGTCGDSGNFRKNALQRVSVFRQNRW